MLWVTSKIQLAKLSPTLSLLGKVWLCSWQCYPCSCPVNGWYTTLFLLIRARINSVQRIVQEILLNAIDIIYELLVLISGMPASSFWLSHSKTIQNFIDIGEGVNMVVSYKTYKIGILPKSWISIKFCISAHEIDINYQINFVKNLAQIKPSILYHNSLILCHFWHIRRIK